MNDTAVLRLAKDITWENKVVEAGDEPTSALKIRSAYIASSIEAAIDERFDARIEARMRELAPDMFKDAPVPPESIMGEPGDTFERAPNNVGGPFVVTSVSDSGVREMIGADGYEYHASLGTLRDPALFRLVKRGAAAAVPAEMAVIADEPEPAVKVGDRFERTEGVNKGRRATLSRFDDDGDAWLTFDDVGEHCTSSEALVDASMWKRIDSDLDGPAGDVTAGRLTVAAEMLRETDTAVRDLIRVWHAYNHDKSVYTTHADFNATVEALAKCAGLPVPWLRPT